MLPTVSIQVKKGGGLQKLRVGTKTGMLVLVCPLRKKEEEERGLGQLFFLSSWRRGGGTSCVLCWHLVGGGGGGVRGSFEETFFQEMLEKWNAYTGGRMKEDLPNCKRVYETMLRCSYSVMYCTVKYTGTRCLVDIDFTSCITVWSTKRHFLMPYAYLLCMKDFCFVQTYCTVCSFSQDV